MTRAPVSAAETDARSDDDDEDDGVADDDDDDTADADEMHT